MDISGITFHVSVTKLSNMCISSYLKWKVEHQTAFETLQSALISNRSCWLKMGLKMGSHNCQKLIDFVLRGTHRFPASLIHDVITLSATFEDHLIHTRTVLERIRKAGLTHKAKKCHVVENCINLFGFEICRGW